MKKEIKVNLHVIMNQIMSETTRKDLHKSLPYAAHLTPVFEHFGVSFENEQAQSIPKSNIYCFKHLQKFMGFRLEGDQVRRGPVVVEAPVAPEDVEPPPEVAQSPPHDQEDQPPNEIGAPMPQDVPHTPPFQASSPHLPDVEIPSFTPHYQASTSASTGGPSVPPELYSFLNEKFDTITSSILQMSESFELRIQRLENSVNAQFIKQKEAADNANQRFNRLIGTYISCKGSVDTPTTGVDTGYQTLRQNHEEMCVDTVPGSVDTSDLSQRASFIELGQCVDKVPGNVDARAISQKTGFVELRQCVDTLHGQVDTLR
ncbi:hypothetical protein Taro_007278 [Colocasia esculenta]|uniref:Uncharacterized protein n=1 Tax=Colocasia esculenta TaxID=4460 RepID=A0A843TXR2_COLES|nr:hypothetical protein [Colocasia esculenta]